MKNIKSFNVLGKKIKVNHIILDLKNNAEYLCQDEVINVNIFCKKEDYDQVLIHELFHATWARAGLDQSGLATEIEEIIVEQFSKVICENFKLTKK